MGITDKLAKLVDVDFFQGAAAGFGGIAVMTLLAILIHIVDFDYKMPTMMALWSFNNLFFAPIPEEGLYHGFLQTALCRYFSSRTLVF